MKSKYTVLTISPDLRSDGRGLASVVKNYYKDYKEEDYDFILLRTIMYKSGKLISNTLCFMISSCKLFFLLLSNIDIKVLHTHSVSYYSFLRKSIVELRAKLFRKKQ